MPRVPSPPTAGLILLGALNLSAVAADLAGDSFAAQACSRSEYAPGHCTNPGANNSSGNGPAGPRARGYQTWVTSVRWPRY